MGTEPKRLTVVGNRAEADLIVNILKENGIPAFIKEYGLGSLYGMYTGVFGDSGIHVFVPEAAYEEAKEIISGINS